MKTLYSIGAVPALFLCDRTKSEDPINAIGFEKGDSKCVMQSLGYSVFLFR